jgi:hypothetical protein
MAPKITTAKTKQAHDPNGTGEAGHDRAAAATPRKPTSSPALFNSPRNMAPSKAAKPAKPAAPAPAPAPVATPPAPKAAAQGKTLKGLVLKKAKVSTARLRWYADMFRANTHDERSAELADTVLKMAYALDELLTEAADLMPEKGTELPFKVGGRTTGGGRTGKEQLAEGTTVRIADKARKRLALLVKDAKEFDHATVIRAANGQVAVSFPGGGQSIVRRADIELLATEAADEDGDE